MLTMMIFFLCVCRFVLDTWVQISFFLSGALQKSWLLVTGSKGSRRDGFAAALGEGVNFTSCTPAG